MLLSQSCNTHFKISVKTIIQDTSNVSSVGEKSAGKYVNYRTSKRIYLATNCFRKQTILRYVIRNINIQSTLRKISCSQYLILQIFICNKEDANATSKATAKAGAYGGAELGSAVGNSICCCCGGIIGNCIGEKYGERAVNRSGLQERAGKVSIV